MCLCVCSPDMLTTVPWLVQHRMVWLLELQSLLKAHSSLLWSLASTRDRGSWIERNECEKLEYSGFKSVSAKASLPPNLGSYHFCGKKKKANRFWLLPGIDKGIFTLLKSCPQHITLFLEPKQILAEPREI